MEEKKSGSQNRTGKTGKRPGKNSVHAEGSKSNIAQHERIKVLRELASLNATHSAIHLEMVETEKSIVIELFHLSGYLAEIRNTRNHPDIEVLEEEFSMFFEKYLQKGLKME